MAMTLTIIHPKNTTLRLTLAIDWPLILAKRIGVPTS